MHATTLPRAARTLALAGLAVLASAAEGAAQAELFAAMPEIADYRMTEANLHKFVAATNALKELEGEDDFDMRDQLDVDDPSELSVATIADAFDREPRVRAAIEGAGMSSREYVTFLMAMVQTIMGSVMVQMGGEQALDDMPDSALKHNIRFFIQHQHVFESLDG